MTCDPRRSLVPSLLFVQVFSIQYIVQQTLSLFLGLLCITISLYTSWLGVPSCLKFLYMLSPVPVVTPHDFSCPFFLLFGCVYFVRYLFHNPSEVVVHDLGPSSHFTSCIYYAFSFSPSHFSRT